MHSILASGLISLGKAFVGKACESFKAQGPHDTFQARLNAAQEPTLNTTGALEIHKNSLERQILQHPTLQHLGLNAASRDPLCISPSSDGTYTLTQGDKQLKLDAKAHPLGTLLHHYYKTREALDPYSKRGEHGGLSPKTFSFHPSSFS